MQGSSAQQQHGVVVGGGGCHTRDPRPPPLPSSTQGRGITTFENSWAVRFNRPQWVAENGHVPIAGNILGRPWPSESENSYTTEIVKGRNLTIFLEFVGKNTFVETQGRHPGAHG